MHHVGKEIHCTEIDCSQENVHFDRLLNTRLLKVNDSVR